MFVLGITGLIGTGKSEVCRLLTKYGFQTIDLDKIAHQSYKVDGGVYKQIVNVFGSNLLKPDLSIDREELGKLVFSDQKKLIELQSLVWPQMDKLIKVEMERLEKCECKLLAMETSLLFQGGWDKFCDQTWYIEASKNIIRTRLAVFRGMSEHSINSRLNAQITVLNNKEKVDRVIINEENLLNLEQIVKKRLDNITKRED